MYCPLCDGVQLREVEKNGVLIDVCPSCKGVWLDRGELDKLMSQVNEQRPAYDEWVGQRERDDYRRPQDTNYRPEYGKDRHDSRYPNQGSHGSHGHHHKKKKSSVFDVFGDLFD
ncbi:TFIIB-type zinc ribbon-containing protein [Paenibacillus tuaregi]|uniref:TFIIB-type zinc ribbon-containing protein n=1 Tax=Paenibacillus tuaregi TaxID=1816681 RepID=UPI000837F0C5|nr:zf-TFIIB domain-containing protein [Paenibacillus tuaregi]